MVGIRTRVLGILAAVVSAIALDTAAVLVAAPTAVAADYVLQNGAPVYLAGAAGSSQNFSLTIPAGTFANLRFDIHGGIGDADLYVKFGSAPTTTSYDCRPYQIGTNETCAFAHPQTGTYYVMVHGYAFFSNVYLVGTFTTGVPVPIDTGLSNNVPVSVPTTPTAGAVYYTMSVPSGTTNLSFKIAGGTGDADLYVRRDSTPTITTYDCRPYITGNTETCTGFSPPAGHWYLMVRAYAAFTGLSLVGTYS